MTGPEISLLKMQKMTIFKILIVLIGPFLATSCAQPPASQLENTTTQSAGIAKDIDVTTFSESRAARPDHILLDVRTPEEIQQAKIQDAMEIDFHAPDFLEKVNQLPKDKPVFVYCRSGNRSGKAMARMHELGFTEVYNLAGGIMAWQNAGLPVTSAK